MKKKIFERTNTIQVYVHYFHNTGLAADSEVLRFNGEDEEGSGFGRTDQVFFINYE